MIIAQRGWKIILASVLGGLVLGIVARLWMRWISTDPEFTWGGTIGIVVAFTIFSTTQATIYAARRRVKTKRFTSVIRGVGIFFTLPLFTAAGAIMFPTVTLISIAVWQKKMDRKVRAALCVIGSVIPIIQIRGFISDFGWTIATLGRTLLFIAIYFTVVMLIKPTISPFEFASEVKIAKGRRNIWIILFIVFATLVFLFFTIGISGN
jgi:hypothetical protein